MRSGFRMGLCAVAVTVVWMATVPTAIAAIAATAGGVFSPTWRCRKGSGAVCTTAELGAPKAFRQVLILSTGYDDAHGGGSAFYGDADRMADVMSDTPGDTVYSEVHRDALLYISYFVDGGALGTATAAFAGKIAQHPIRGQALSHSVPAVESTVAQLQSASLPWLVPSAVAVLFATDDSSITANATPPSFTGKAYGIARLGSADLGNSYIASHELGHALLSWVDEYVEEGFENLSITSLDVLTPLVLLDGTYATLDDAVGDLFNIYDFNFSDILANNGSDNVSLSRYPATVSSVAPSEVYEIEGGMFFGRGTWHDSGRNLMNSNNFNSTPQNGFEYAHSPAQQRIVSTVFPANGAAAGRANDRLRNAGPVDGWPLAFGSVTQVMMFDADKNHHWHPTQNYDVRVGWYERKWQTCWSGPFPYPCYTNVWRTAQKTVSPSKSTVQLRTSTLYGLASLTQNVLCGLGLGSTSQGIDLCELSVEQMSDAFLPTFEFLLPYQTTNVPASQWFTTYYWQFRTNNGRYASGFTSWSSFYRYF